MKLKTSTILLLFCICIGMQVRGKSISIQIDSDDLLKILKELAGIEVVNYRKTARHDNLSKVNVYNNPYHPEDDNINGNGIPSLKTNKNLKKVSQDEILEKENSRIEAKIENENKDFFKSTSSSKETDLTDNNAIEENINKTQKFDFDKNMSTVTTFKNLQYKPLQRRFKLKHSRQ